MKRSRLLVELIARQGERPDKDFAQTLGLSRQLWRMICQGERRIGIISLGRVLAHYPELAVEVLDYVRGRNSE